MKNLLQFILIFAAFVMGTSTTQGQGRAVLYGKVSNPTSRSLKFQYQVNSISPDVVVVETDLDGNGEYAIALDMEEPTLVTFTYDRKEMPLFLSPDNQMEFNFNSHRFYASMQFSGIGTNDNSFLHRYILKFGVRDRFAETIVPPSLSVPDSIFDKMNVLLPEDFLAYIQKLQSAERDFYQNDPIQEDLSYAMKNYWEAMIQYKWAAYLMAYAELRQKRGKPVPDEFFIFLWDVELSNDNAIAQPEYGTYLDFYLRYTLRSIQKDSLSTDAFTNFAHTFELAQKHLKDFAEEYMLARLLLRATNVRNVPFLSPYIDEFRRVSLLTPFRRTVTDAYDRALAFSDSQPAPDFQLLNENGDTVSLQQFKGKMVYISFWASWCQPCLKELEESLSNRLALTEQDIVFLYVSVDETTDLWKQALQRHPTYGVNIWAHGRESTVTRAFNVVALPHYFLVDKEGRFISEFKKASDPAFVFDIKKRLDN